MSAEKETAGTRAALAFYCSQVAQTKSTDTAHHIWVMTNNLYTSHVDLTDILSNDFTTNTKADSKEECSVLYAFYLSKTKSC